MGSRRARRSHGRVQPAFPTRSNTIPNPTISKSVKKSQRVQQKTAILTAARLARAEKSTQPPVLMALLSITSANDNTVEEIATQMRTTKVDKKTPAFEIMVLKRDGLSERQIFISALDAAKVADIVTLVFDGRSEIDDGTLDVINALRAQGMPSLFSLAVGEGADDAELRKLRGRQLAAESLGEDHALRPIQFSLLPDDKSEEMNKMALRRMFGKKPRSITWRARHGYMKVESANVLDEAGDGGRLRLSGWVRGRGFSPDELVHVTGIGSFALQRIVDEHGGILAERGAAGEDVASVGEVDDMMGEQTWPPEVDDEDGDGEDEDEAFAKEYDAAADAADKEDGTHGDENDAMTMEKDDLEVDEDDNMSIDEEEVRQAKLAAKTDAEFPDEVDTPIDQPARKRFARYRGLKSLRTGEWDPKEQLPREYASLFQFGNLASTRKRILEAARKEAEDAAKEPDTRFVTAGRKVCLELCDVSHQVMQAIMKRLQQGCPVVAAGLLRHENRRSVVHFGVTRVEDGDETVVKAKTHLEVHCGFMRFDGRPMFSEHNANSDKHKMERFLTHGRYTVASVYGPAQYTPAPALLCYPDGKLLAIGRALGADVDRIVLKRIILTGYPFKTQKRRAVVKFMFFNPEDVRWFKPVELWSKLGRVGHIVEAIGTHGLMKCIFDGVVQHHDTVCITLYKRVYPKLLPGQQRH